MNIESPRQSWAMYKYDHIDQTLVDQRVIQFRDQVARRLKGTLAEEEFRPLRLQNGLYHQRHAYMLRVAGLEDASRVLFIDEQLSGHADYQSALALIGLKQMYGLRCEVAFPVDYVYEDTTVNTGRLYGRGFGYTRVLSKNARTEKEMPSHSIRGVDGIDWDLYDLVVVGSISRNHALAWQLLQVFPAERTIWIHGEDSPPTIREAHQLRQSGANIFVRSIS